MVQEREEKQRFSKDSKVKPTGKRRMQDRRKGQEVKGYVYISSVGWLDRREKFRRRKGEYFLQSDLSEKVLNNEKDLLVKDITTIDFIQEYMQWDLTTEYLQSIIIPFLFAIEKIQKIIDEIEDNDNRVRILSISHSSPISASIEGAAKAVDIISKLVVPWRRKHAKKIADLMEQERKIALEKAKIEINALRIQNEKEEVRKQQRIDLAKQYAELEKTVLENEKIKLELAEAKMDLALTFLNKVSSSLSERERISYTLKLLPELEILISSPLIEELKFKKKNKE